MKIEIVRFDNGRYGVRRKKWAWLFLEFEFEFLKTNCEWDMCRYPSVSAAFDTAEEAKKALQSRIEQEKRLEHLGKDFGEVTDA